MAKKQKEPSKRKHPPVLYEPGDNRQAAAPAVILDVEKYRPLLADQNLSAAQEREYIEIVWTVLRQAMRLGIAFEIKAGPCGKDAEISFSPPLSKQNKVQLKDQNFNSGFNQTAQKMRETTEKESSK